MVPLQGSKAALPLPLPSPRSRELGPRPSQGLALGHASSPGFQGSVRGQLGCRRHRWCWPVLAPGLLGAATGWETALRDPFILKAGGPAQPWPCPHCWGLQMLGDKLQDREGEVYLLKERGRRPAHAPAPCCLHYQGSSGSPPLTAPLLREGCGAPQPVQGRLSQEPGSGQGHVGVIPVT